MKNRRMWQRAKGILPADASEVVARADGILTANGEYGKDWGFIDSQAEIANNFQFLQISTMEIEGHGPNAGLMGRGTEDQSGKAIALQQNAGMAEENDIFDIHNDWKLRVYRAMWYRTKQFKTSEWYVRVTEDNEAPRFVGLNTPKPKPQIGPDGQPVLNEKGEPVPMMGPDGKPVPEIDPATGQQIPGWKKPPRPNFEQVMALGDESARSDLRRYGRLTGREDAINLFIEVCRAQAKANREAMKNG